MKIALISHLFPTELHPHLGKFILDQLNLLQTIPSLNAELFVPTPYSIPFTHRHKKNNAELLAHTNGSRINYVSFAKKRLPKLISISLSGSVKKQLTSKDFDLVHVHWLYPDALCIPALKKMGHKCILTIHGSDWYRNKNNPALYRLFSSILEKTDIILYSGPKLKTDVEAEFPQLAEKSHVIYNYVEESKYTLPSDSQKKQTKSKLGWDTEQLHALTVANIRREKGVDILIDSIKQSKPLKDIQFHIIGSIGSDPYSRQIQQEVKTAPHQNIHLHPPVSPDQLIQYYHAADFFVQPSRREGFSVSVLEAMSCGLPAVCTDVGGNHLLINNQTGCLVAPPFLQKLEGQIIKLSEHLHHYSAEEIRQQVISTYGSEAFKNRLKNLYTELLNH